jgi:starvation-inducible DNA-binding protein
METTTKAPEGITEEQATKVADVLQQRLNALIDLQITLKHVHWNVVGPTFIAVHEMLDPQVDAVREMTDDVAERIATIGREPNGLPGHVVAKRSWDDYSLGTAPVGKHLEALDSVYDGVVKDHRAARTLVADIDVVTEDLLIGQLADLEQFQWFVAAHLRNASF